MSDIDQNKQMSFLQAVYDLANETQSRSVQGPDVAERLGLDLNGEEFHDLARYHMIAGNIEAIETNWGLLDLTDKGKAKVERHAAQSQRERRDRFLSIAYDRTMNERVPYVELTDVSEELGIDINEARQIARNFVNKGLIENMVDGYGILNITAAGVDEVEGEEPTPQTWGDVLYGNTRKTSDVKAAEEAPPAIRDSLREFEKDHPDPAKVAFILMQFGRTRAHEEITKAVKNGLAAHGIIGVRADDKEYLPDLFPNVQTYMHGCGFGVAVFERIEEEKFNPNVSLEVGYMYAIGKQLCLLKDRTLTALHTDLVGRLYREFDPYDPDGTIPSSFLDG